MDALAVIRDMVAVAGNCVDIIETMLQAQLLERIHASWLQKFSNNSVWFLETPFQQNYTASLFPESDSGGASHDAGPYDDDLGLMVDATQEFRVV